MTAGFHTLSLFYARLCTASHTGWFSRVDESILRFFNQTLAHPALDAFFVTITSSRFIKPALSALILALMWKGRRKGRIIVVLAILCIAFTDLTNRYIWKEFFARPRPSHTLAGLRLPMGYGGDYGFPSNHAANLFGVAVLLSFFYRRLAVPLFLFAILASWAKVYVGKHYPTDILAGAIYGALVGGVFIYLGRNQRRLPAPEAAPNHGGGDAGKCENGNI